MLADSSEGEWLSTERLADHGRDKNKEQTPSIDCRGDGKRPIVKQLAVCTQLPRLAPEGWKGSETPYRLASHDPHISRPPYFLIKIWS